MANKSKDRGTRWESACAAFLRDHGFPEVHRLALTGEHDQGDLHVDGVSVAWECRDRNRLTLSENVDDAEARAKAKGSKFGVTVMKRRGRRTGDAYVAMTLSTFVRLLHALENSGGASSIDRA